MFLNKDVDMDKVFDYKAYNISYFDDCRDLDDTIRMSEIVIRHLWHP